ncbi:MAG TPA: tRNA lysidine(34) synthetase TilS, partial [Egibacteraceae bacterium]|nr:tRNA lysidine(34) synthetase TilS [Egibacteraceae bacterium]
PGAPKPLKIVRPLLRVRRGDVRTFVADEGLAAVSDPTNRDPGQRRARARSGVLPALAGLSGGPGDPVGTLCRLADLARDDAEALEVLAAQHARRLMVAWGPVRAVRSQELEALPAALAARIVRLLLAAVRGRLEGLTADAVAAVLGLRPGQAVHVPGGTWVTAGGGWLAAAPPTLQDLTSRALTVPGVTALPEIGVAVHAAEAGDGGHPYASAPGGPPGPPPGPLGPLPPRARQPRGPASRPWALLPVEGSRGLTVRSRRPGDRMRLTYGSRSVADLLADLGVPRAARGLVPVVASAHEQPLWVPGVALGCGGSSPPAHARVWLAPVR